MSDPLRLAIGLIVVSASALGYGLLVARFTKSNSNLAQVGVIGIAILTIVYAMVHFFVPLRQPWNFLTLLPGLIGLGLLFRRRFLVDLAIVAVIVWWAVQISRTGVASYDHGLYHLQAAIWNTMDRAMPGIANLHVRLGFNSSVFVLASGLDIPSLGGWSLSFLATALIEAMIIGDIALSIRAEKRIVRFYSIIVLICLLLEPGWLLYPSYLSSDPVVALGVIYVGMLFLDMRIPALLLIVPFLITIKLSAAPLLLLLDWNRDSLKKNRVAAIVGTLILCIWVARSVVLSGYLLFPVAATRLPVPWAVPAWLTRQTASWITSWARAPGKLPAETTGIGWMGPWFLRFVKLKEVRAAALMVSTGAFLLVWKRKIRSVDSRLLFAFVLAFLYWFLAAPDVRFGIGFLFTSGFLMLAYGLSSIDRFRLEAKSALITMTLLVAAMGLSAPRSKQSDWPRMERPNVRLASTPSGYQIWTPIAGDQCWAVIPCSPEPQWIEYYPNRALLLAPAQ